MKQLVTQVDPSISENAALSTACREKKADIVKFLLADSRIDPSYPNNSPLLQASKGGNADIIEALLQDPRVSPNSFHYTQKELYRASVTMTTPLVTAISENNKEAAETLLEHSKTDPTLLNGEALIAASRKNYSELASKMLSMKKFKLSMIHRALGNLLTDPDNITSETLLLLIKHCNKEKFLEKHITALQCYLHSNRTVAPILQILLTEFQLDPSIFENIFLKNACQISVELVKTLLKDPRVDPNKCNALQLAALNSNGDIVKILLQSMTPAAIANTLLTVLKQSNSNLIPITVPYRTRKNI